jgi:2-iminobutanoate/2-iminopropanoate deaminase
MKEVVSTPNAPAAIGPYSQGIIGTGSLVFCSGQLPIDPATGIMPAQVKEQARQSLLNVKAVLEAAGSSMDQICKTTCFLADIKDFAAFNEVYSEFFGKNPPARSAVGIAALPKGALVEIEAIAIK